MGRKRGLIRAATAAVVLLSLTGCGAAFYGAAIAIFATQQKKTTTTKTSFPDAVPTADVVPPFATIALTSNTVTITRKVTSQSQTSVAQVSTTTSTSTTTTQTQSSQSSTSSTTVTLTDFQILSVDFPPGYGQARSNRDTGTTLLAGDKLIIRINEDDAVALTFAAADVASTGTGVATAIQAKVRALAPKQSSVPPEAYTRFTAAFDPVTGSYLFTSGAPGETSEVVFEAAARTGSGVSDAATDATSSATATRLGLGVSHGGIETSGADSVSCTVINRGNDTIPAGTAIDLYLSHTKVLDKTTAVLFDSISTDATIAVGQARRFSRRNGSAPPKPLLRQDLTAGSYYVIFDVQPANGEQVIANNQLTSTHPVEVYQPAVDPAVAAAAQVTKFSPLDFVITNTAGPIGVVAGKTFTSVVAVTNYGSPVSQAVPLDIDVVFSVDPSFQQEPAGFLDPAGVLAGVHVNPTNPNRPVNIVINQTTTGTISTSVANDTVSVSFNASASGAGIATVQSLVDALNQSSGTPVDAFVDGHGSPTTDSLKSLLTAANKAKDRAAKVFVTTFHGTFVPVSAPNQTQTFLITGPTHATGFAPAVLPIKMFPFYRVRPHLAAGSDPENDKNNVRQGVNYVRVCDPARATFDSVTGALLPTASSADFAQLDAVTQRPVNTGSIEQGQHRVFSFSIPDEGLSFDQSQLLVILRAPTFDARLDLLSSSGDFLASSDDSGLGTSPIIYTPVQADSNTRTFYLVIAPARVDESDLSGGGATFDLTISVNPRLGSDPGAVSPINADNELRDVKQRFDPPATAARIENNVLIPFSLITGKGEIVFVLPQPARVKFRTAPVFSTGVDTTITSFVLGQVPTPVVFQAELDENFNRIVYRPKGADINTSFVLQDGVYTVAFDTTASVSDPDLVRLELDVEYVPDTIQKATTGQ